ncbi:LexA family protein [Vibrio gangliei]|uniref:LexA family protein n=1 Tax=Vibrio gangliei TaxID=2077090 RepID=UPI000D014182|nr:S24 family peptidase [Vibrio gangliei]
MKVIPIPLSVSAGLTGFASPADSYVQKRLSLDDLLIRDQQASYFCRVSGNSMSDEAVIDGDILLVDRSLPVRQNSPIVCNYNGEMLYKRIDLANRLLLSSNEQFPPIPVSDTDTCSFEGVVTAVIRKMEL